MKLNIKLLLLIVILIFFLGFLYGAYIFYNFYKVNQDIEFYFDNYGNKINFQSDGLTIAGTIYGLRDNNNETLHPGIILVHGETTLGKKLPLYRILAKEFIERGYIVLTYDRRGLGESDTPNETYLVDSWNEYSDISQAVSYIYSLEEVDKNKIYAIGHSGGSYPVMEAGLKDSRIKKIVLIGPPRRIEERILADNAADREYILERKAKNRRLDNLMPLDTFLSICYELKILYEEYKTQDHLPILLIDGELENKLYLKNYFNELKEPKKYHTINDTGHYLNTTNIGNVMIYNKKVLDDTVDLIDDWFKDD